MSSLGKHNTHEHFWNNKQGILGKSKNESNKMGQGNEVWGQNTVKLKCLLIGEWEGTRRGIKTSGIKSLTISTGGCTRLRKIGL